MLGALRFVPLVIAVGVFGYAMYDLLVLHNLKPWPWGEVTLGIFPGFLVGLYIKWLIPIGRYRARTYYRVS